MAVCGVWLRTVNKFYLTQEWWPVLYGEMRTADYVISVGMTIEDYAIIQGFKGC